jgi:hypothetical protein
LKSEQGWFARSRRNPESVPASIEGAKEMIRKLKSGEYRLYSRKKNPKTGKRRNLGTFKSRKAAEEHEKAIQYFKRH